MSLSNDKRDALLRTLVGKTPAYSVPNDWYLALLTSSPGNSGSTATEVNGAGYSRKKLADALGNSLPEGLTDISPGTALTQSDTDIEFGPATANWPLPVTHIGIYDHATSLDPVNFVAGMPLMSSPVLCVFDANSNFVYAAANHTFVLDTPLRVYGRAYPSGISPNTIYYCHAPNAGAFQIKSVSGGATPLSLGSQGIAWVGRDRSQTISNGSSFRISAGAIRIMMAGV